MVKLKKKVLMARTSVESQRMDEVVGTSGRPSALDNVVPFLSWRICQ